MLNQGATLDRLFQAIGDPTRRQIVERLSLGPLSVSELAAPLTISLAAVVQHVQVLEWCGLVRSEKLGRTRTCQVDPGGLGVVEQWVADRRSLSEERLDRLGAFFVEQPEPPTTTRS